MDLYESLRSQQAAIINQNPASIIISRITRTYDSTGGFSETVSTLAAQTVRIYSKNKRVLNIADGGFAVSKITKMLMLYDADVESENETYLDTFTYLGKDYKVKYVEDITTQGQIVWKQVEIEEIN